MKRKHRSGWRGRIGRREFLKKAALVGGAAALGPTLWLPRRTARAQVPSILDLAAPEAPIKHIVVLMMENRSVDHYFGWLAEDEVYIEAGMSRWGEGFAIDADRTQTFDGVDTYYLPDTTGEENPYRGCGHPDPGHGWDSGRVQRDSGFLAAGSGNDEYALGYYRSEDLPVYAALARRFTVFDKYHCSLLASTFPNREYMHSAQSGGIKNNALPSSPTGFEWPTIWDRLIAALVPSAYYFVDLPATGLWGPRLAPITRHIEHFFADCAAGTLPNVVFVDPGFTTGLRTDDHPFADIRSGQKLVRDVFEAFAKSSHWQSGVFFINYDEWGGFFDHVAPPVLPDDRESLDDDENFGQAGFRVPAIMASPFAPRGYVDHTLYDHTSILRFIEWRFLGAPASGPGNDDDTWFLTKRDRNANNIGLALGDTPDLEWHPELLPQVPLTSPPCRGEVLEGIAGPVSDAEKAITDALFPPESEMHAFEMAYRAGFFERMGYDIDLERSKWLVGK